MCCWVKSYRCIEVRLGHRIALGYGLDSIAEFEGYFIEFFKLCFLLFRRALFPC
jgi:hypothetical protein